MKPYLHANMDIKAHGGKKEDYLDIHEFIDSSYHCLPDKCCGMDLALLGDDSVKVIEFNCINASGFYANDVHRVFDALWEYHKEK